MSSWIIGPAGTPHRRQAVRDLDAVVVHLDVVEQPELDDVHAELRVLDLAERLVDLFTRRHRCECS